MVGVLQLFHRHSVHLGDRSECLTACDGVRICACRMWRRCSCSRRAGRRGSALSDHHARAHVGDLLFQLEDFLRKRVNLRVLFVYLFHERFKLSCIIRLARFLRRGLSRRSAKQPENERRTKNQCELHRGKTLPLADLSGKQLRDVESLKHLIVKTEIGCYVLTNHDGCSLPFQYLLLDFFMPERIQKPVEPAPWGPKQGDGGGPRSPDVSRPDTKDLLKKMRKVDPNQSKRYRQRTGQ